MWYDLTNLLVPDGRLLRGMHFIFDASQQDVSAGHVYYELGGKHVVRRHLSSTHAQGTNAHIVAVWGTSVTAGFHHKNVNPARN